MAIDRHAGTTLSPGGFKATGYAASNPGDALNINPAPGINWFEKLGELGAEGISSGLKTGNFGLTDADALSR